MSASRTVPSGGSSMNELHCLIITSYFREALTFTTLNILITTSDLITFHAITEHKDSIHSVYATHAIRY